MNTTNSVTGSGNAPSNMRDKAETIKPGDVIMPPERELRLWMRRHVAEKQLPETALHLRVTQIREGKRDKRGPWLIIRTEHSEPFAFALFTFSFRARPETQWKILSRAEVQPLSEPTNTAANTLHAHAGKRPQC